MDRIEVEEARRQIASGDAQALDVREEDAWRDAHIPGAVKSVDELAEKVAVVIVADGDPSDEVTIALDERGIEARILDGGMDSWKDADFTLQPTDDVDESEEVEA